ncbi:glycohydrolase toxin TNT-related protein [Cellulomonas sp. zg-ZUI22]|uniref:glycohydrolase toxin TNT-related protein n=1 Tax=Cellulomonas sp. zg-ZUI22 TaxID=2816955 RepID=UPI0035AB7357
MRAPAAVGRTKQGLRSGRRTARGGDRRRPRSIETSLPPGHLARELHNYEFTGRLPHGLTIEVSEIEPAFGRPGGGVQVRFMKGTKPVPIADLLPGSGSRYEGVLK